MKKKVLILEYDYEIFHEKLVTEKYEQFWNMEYQKEYSKKNGTQSKYRKIWNMEYSRNIQQKSGVTKIYKILEYGKNIPGIFQKMYHNAWGRKV